MVARAGDGRRWHEMAARAGDGRRWHEMVARAGDGMKWQLGQASGQTGAEIIILLRCRSINNLEPFTQYLVGVATQTRGPLGNFSEDVLVQTMSAGVSAVVCK